MAMKKQVNPDSQTVLGLGRGRPLGRFIGTLLLLIVVAIVASELLPYNGSHKTEVILASMLLAGGWAYMEASFVCYLTVVIDADKGCLNVQQRYIVRTVEHRLKLAAVEELRMTTNMTAFEAGSTVSDLDAWTDLWLTDGSKISLTIPCSYSPFGADELADFVKAANKAIASARSLCARRDVVSIEYSPH